MDKDKNNDELSFKDWFFLYLEGGEGKIEGDKFLGKEIIEGMIRTGSIFDFLLIYVAYSGKDELKLKFLEKLVEKCEDFWQRYLLLRGLVLLKIKCSHVKNALAKDMYKEGTFEEIESIFPWLFDGCCQQYVSLEVLIPILMNKAKTVQHYDSIGSFLRRLKKKEISRTKRHKIDSMVLLLREKQIEIYDLEKLKTLYNHGFGCSFFSSYISDENENKSNCLEKRTLVQIANKSLNCNDWRFVLKEDPAGVLGEEARKEIKKLAYKQK